MCFIGFRWIDSPQLFVLPQLFCQLQPGRLFSSVLSHQCCFTGCFLFNFIYLFFGTILSELWRLLCENPRKCQEYWNGHHVYCTCEFLWGAHSCKTMDLYNCASMGPKGRNMNFCVFFPINSYISSCNIWSEQPELTSTLRVELLDRV